MYKIIRLDTLEEFAESRNKKELEKILKNRTWYIDREFFYDGSQHNYTSIPVNTTIRIKTEIKYFDNFVDDSYSYITIPQGYMHENVIPRHLFDIIEIPDV